MLDSKSPSEPPRTAKSRAAASLIVVRDSPGGLQVLLLRRADREGDQNGGATVFPGGLLDDSDRGHYERCIGLDDATASDRLALPSHGLHYWVAALRECFEEAGLLFALDAGSCTVDLASRDADELRAMRGALHANAIGMADVCARLGVRLDAGALAYHSHWMTPLGMPKIFDTRFFIARAPAGQAASADGTETVEVLWLTPREALDPARGLKFLLVTAQTLRALSTFADAGAAIAAARARREVPMTRPRIGRGSTGKRPIAPGEPAFAEVGRLDPEGRGDVGIEPVPGRPVWLSPNVMRVIAPNGSLMTGPGTNGYFVGTPGVDDWALIDPGPDDARHIEALLAAAPGKVTRILVTHTHKDHSPAVAAIRAATGAPTFGRVAEHPEWQDATFSPDHVVEEGDRIVVGQGDGPGVTLRAVRTPGHASNHVCWLLEEEKLLFTGDHLMQGSTVVINPPDGDMAVYLHSLERLLEEDLEWLAPGHGFLIDRPHDEVRKTVAHRLAREALVLADVFAHPATTPEAMVERVYAAVDRRLHPVALRSLRAHLFKLRDQAQVDEDEAGRWRAMSSSVEGVSPGRRR